MPALRQVWAMPHCLLVLPRVPELPPCCPRRFIQHPFRLALLAPQRIKLSSPKLYTFKNQTRASSWIHYAILVASVVVLPASSFIQGCPWHRGRRAAFVSSQSVFDAMPQRSQVLQPRSLLVVTSSYPSSIPRSECCAYEITSIMSWSNVGLVGLALQHRTLLPRHHAIDLTAPSGPSRW